MWKSLAQKSENTLKLEKKILRASSKKLVIGATFIVTYPQHMFDIKG